jgi:hypothetical protein
MKVKQVVGEHKKGVKAKIYPKRPKPLIGVEAQKKAEEKRQAEKAKPPMNESPDQNRVYAMHEKLLATNPQYAAEASKIPAVVRGMGPDSAKHNAMVFSRITQLVQKYSSGAPVQEETPGSEVGTTTSPVKPDGTVDVKKADGTVVPVNQQDLKPGATPNTLTMPTPKVMPGEKVIAAPVATESADNELLEKMRVIAGLR